MSKDLVSVVIPIYRVEKYLRRCLDSVISQSYENIEIILVNDGSDDHCHEICLEYKEKDDRIVYIQKENGGLSDARNTGIKASRGKYITFVDSDDTIGTDYVKQLYETLIENDADISLCGYTVMYDNGSVISHFSDKKMVLSQKDALEKLEYQEDFDSASVAKLYKRELFDKVLFPVGKIFEDSFTTYKFFLECEKIACNMVSQYNYLIRSNSILTAEFSMKKLTLIDAYDEMGKAIVQKYPNLEDAAIRGYVYSRISTLRQMINCSPRLKDIENKIRKEILKYRKNILRNKRVNKRDKTAVIILLFGTNVFRFCWNLYCSHTGRNM